MTAWLKGTAEVTKPQVSVLGQCLACSEASLLTRLTLQLEVGKAQAVQCDRSSGDLSNLRECKMLRCNQAVVMPHYAVMLPDKQCVRRGEGKGDSLVPEHNVSGATQGVMTYTVRTTGVATLQQLSVTLYVMTYGTP